MIKRIASLMFYILDVAFVAYITCKALGIDDELGIDDKLKFVVSADMPNSGKVVGFTNSWVVRIPEELRNKKVSVNGDYRLLGDAKVDLDEVSHDNMVVRITLDDMSEKVQLWEDGPYWATMNIGAEKPEDYGYYFWWGDTVGYKRENNKWVASDGSNSKFSFNKDNTPTDYKDKSTLQSEGWITAGGVLAPEHDAAQKHWGGDWRMPTIQEFDDLNCECDWIWTTMNGVNGYVVRGKGDYASNSIFLPCAGYGHDTALHVAGSFGVYWSSVPDGILASYLYFHSDIHYACNEWRDFGRSVRPVQSSIK